MTLRYWDSCAFIGWLAEEADAVEECRAVIHAAEDGKTTGINPKDAVHVATAIDVEADRMETFDRDLIKKSGTVGTPPLDIGRPNEPGTLF